jgi:hypothetical protein
MTEAGADWWPPFSDIEILAGNLARYNEMAARGIPGGSKLVSRGVVILIQNHLIQLAEDKSHD